MGNQQQYGKSVETFLLKYLPQINYKMTLHDSLLFYTILSTLEDEGPIICRMHYSKIEDDKFSFYESQINKIRDAFNLYRHPNVLVFDKIFNVQKKAMLGVRQFVCHNLKEKLHRIPKLSTMEKKWLVFQLLCAISQIHSAKMVHGDIKPSNILLTSYNQLFLADMLPFFKPAYISGDDLKTYNLYFGELDNNQRCYIAPERFKSDISEAQFDPTLMDPSMDIFSAGCVIAEIFLDRKDGRVLFDLAQLQNYRKGVYDPREELMKQIRDTKIVNLIMSMISREPRERETINEYIIQWKKEVLPDVFSQVLFQINSAFVRNEYLFSDLKIGLIRKYINSIWNSCFGKKNAVVSESFNEPIEPFVFERIRDDTLLQYDSYLVPSNELFVFLSPLQLEEIYKTDSSKRTHDDKEAIIVVVHWIGVFITTCYYPQSKCCALEMLYKMAVESSVDIRLQFILPYVFQLFDDENSRVKAKAIQVAVHMFKDIMDKAYLTTLSATDYKVFDNYILPNFLRLKNDNAKDTYVQHVFVSCLPLLAQIGHRFLELSIGSRFQRHYRHKNNQVPGEEDKNNLPEISREVMEGQVPIYDDEDDNASDRLFQQSEFLLTNNHHRTTVVIKDTDLAQQHRQQHDIQEVSVNYDNEYDKLRRIILSLINDISSQTDPTLQRILYQNMGNFAVFFGRKMTIDNLIPLQTSCFNKKDFRLDIECLRGLPYLGLRVGQLTLSRFLLIAFTHLLRDTQENVVYETMQTLNKLLQFGLLSKEDSLEQFENIVPFIMHPNQWIKEAAQTYIDFLSDPNNKILTAAQAYCLVKPIVKKVKNQGPFVTDKDKQHFKGLEQTLNIFNKISNMSILDNDQTKTYRIIKQTFVSQLSGVSFGQSQFQMIKANQQHDQNQENYEERKLGDPVTDTLNEYLDLSFYAFNSVPHENVENKNNGLNSRALQNNLNLNFEADWLLQGLNLVPDDPEIPIINYKNPNYFMNMSAQTLPIGCLLSVEQSAEVPQQLPQFGQQSKIAQLAVNSSNRDYYLMGQQNNRFSKWRPTGRLITTLFEHKNAVNTLAITDDSHFFLTGSKLDQQIKIWLTKEIEGDVTSHSHLAIQTKRQVNQISTIDNSNYFVVAGSHGVIDIYQMARVEQEAALIQNPYNQDGKSFRSRVIPDKNQQYMVGNYETNETSIIKSIEKKDEGDILMCTNMVLPVSHNHLLAYVTQRGSLYMHDLRTRLDVSNNYELLGCQRGMPTCMTIGQDPYQLYFGTLGGYIMIYDLRYQLLSAQFKHVTRAPINSIATFHPQVYNNMHLNANRSDAYSPLVLVSTGNINYEVSLLNLETSSVDVLLSVDDRLNRENYSGGLPTVPSFLRESVFQESDYISSSSGGFRKNETNDSLFRRYLQTYQSTKQFNKLMSYQQQSLVRNLDEDWLKNSKNRFMNVKTAYESGNACRKIFVPRASNSLLDKTETCTYAITGGNDKKIRYWDFTGLKKKSFCVNSPCDDEHQYLEENQGETLVVQEKLQQYKQFPQLNAQLLSRQFDAGVQNVPNVQPANANSTYYPILTGILNGQGSLAAEAQGTQSGKSQQQSALNANLRQNFQSEKLGEMEVIYNFNGLSEWQHFNGVSMNQGCTSSSADQHGKQDFFYRDSQVVSHQDCILDIGMLEMSSSEPILITCGRDGLVKLWR